MANPDTLLMLAQAVLAIHIAAAAFIVFGLVVIPLGARCRWAFVHGFSWRVLHVAVLGTVAVQKLLGQTCFLSVWENNLLDRVDQRRYHIPVIHTWGDRLIHVDVPMWVLVTLYVLLWVYVLWLWRRVPPQLPAWTRRLVAERAYRR